MSGLVVTAYGVPRSYPDPLLSVGWHKVGLVKIYPLRTDWWLPETKGGGCVCVGEMGEGCQR